MAQRTKYNGAARSASGGTIQRQARINDGKRLLVISHTGEIYPSGSLEVSAGNIRHTNLQDAYRRSNLFRVLRDSGALSGKCGVCKYKNLCGGSRSRAFALTGDYFASDPRCAYMPPLGRSLCIPN